MAQQLIARAMPERVVNALELIEIEEQDRQRSAQPLCTLHSHGEAFLEGFAIRQACQAIEIRQFTDFLLGKALLGDVLYGRAQICALCL